MFAGLALHHANSAAGFKAQSPGGQTLNMVGWDYKRGKAFGSPDIQNNIVWKIVSKIINLLLHPVLLNIPAGRISTKRPWRMSSIWKKDGMTLPKHRLYQRRKFPKD